MENTNDKKLSFPQRNWFLICVVVAILSPLVVHWITIGAHRVSKEQSLDIKDRKDTSYNVASPPSNDTSSKTKDSATH